MKTLNLQILATAFALALFTTAHAQNGPSGDAAATNAFAPEQPRGNDNSEGPAMAPAALPDQSPSVEINQTIVEPPAVAAPDAQPPPPATSAIRPAPQAPQTLVAPSERVEFTPPAAGTNGAKELRLNFRGAPIEMVLNYLSDAAGFIIELDTAVHGKVDIWSNQPVTKEEALELLNSVLNKNGYAMIRNGRTLRIMSRDEAIHSDIPVTIGNDPKAIPKTDEIVTQIIPVRFVEAKQLVSDLSPMISSRATIIANEAGNSLIITDTQVNIRHVVEIVKAIDTGAEAVTEVRVFHLQYHDPVEVAALLTSLFSDSSNGGNQNPIRFGGGGGGGGGGFGRFLAAAGGFGGGQQGGGGGGGNNNVSNDRIKKYNRVVAVADQRTSSVVVTAAKDLIEQIGGMIEQIDRESTKVGKVSVIHLENADPQQVQQVLQDMFQSSNNRNTRSSQTSVLMNRNSSTQNQNNNSTTSAFGSQGVGGGGNRSFGQ
jgi:general secretion pathway protein D